MRTRSFGGFMFPSRNQFSMNNLQTVQDKAGSHVSPRRLGLQAKYALGCFYCFIAQIFLYKVGADSQRKACDISHKTPVN